MSRDELHISDEELLLTADGEVAARRSAQIHAHLAACPTCRARMTEIESAVADYVRAHGESQPQLPPIEGPRALLRAQLAQLAHQRSLDHSWLWSPSIKLARLAAIGAAVAAAVLVGGVFLLHQAPHGFEAGSAPFERGELPEHNLTPGATRNVSIGEICSAPHEEVVREVSDSTREAVFKEYGIANARAEDYEIDYLIAPRLGGAEDIHNLWPQPYTARTWNAYVKDALEERLHQLVCSGNLDLATAQRDISTDWIAAYKKYLHTDSPISRNERFDSANEVAALTQ